MKEEKMPEGFKSLLNDEEINKIDEEIEELQKKKHEKEEIVKYHQKVKENKILAKNNIDLYDSEKQKVVKKSFYKLLKYSIICLLIVIIAGIIVFAFLVADEKLKSQVFCGDAKAECQICSPCGNTTCEAAVCNNNCPNITLSCDFPQNLSINIINSS